MRGQSPVRNLIDLQRAAKFRSMGEQARQLLAQGYAAEADRVLDEMIERQQAWSQDR